MSYMRFVNFSSIQVIGFLFLVSSPLYVSDFLNGKHQDLFNKLATLAALSALVISIFNEAATNAKMNVQNIRSRLETKLSFILRQFDLITFDFPHANNVPGSAKGFHAFRIAMGDLLGGGRVLNRSHANFSFWEAQIVLDHINYYFDEIQRLETELTDHYKDVISHSMDCITPILHVYQEFYNQFHEMTARGAVASPALAGSMAGLYSRLDGIQHKYKTLKAILK